MIYFPSFFSTKVIRVFEFFCAESVREDIMFWIDATEPPVWALDTLLAGYVQKYLCTLFVSCMISESYRRVVVSSCERNLILVHTIDIFMLV